MSAVIKRQRLWTEILFGLLTVCAVMWSGALHSPWMHGRNHRPTHLPAHSGVRHTRSAGRCSRPDEDHTPEFASNAGVSVHQEHNANSVGLAVIAVADEPELRFFERLTPLVPHAPALQVSAAHSGRAPPALS
jgi:hypothetical protein